MTRMVLLAVSMLSCAVAVAAQSPTTLDSAAIWERMIAAKGGRERLHAVRTFVVAVDGKVPKSFTARDVIAKEDTETVIALPDRGWQWADFRPGHMGFGADAWDTDRGIEWLAINGGPAKRFENWGAMREWDRRWLVRKVQLLYFLETQWVRPVVVTESSVGPLRVIRTPEEQGRNRLRVTVRLDGFGMVSYLVDESTFRPVEVTVDALLDPGPNDQSSRTIRSSYRLDDVVTIDGLQMPRKVNGEDVRFTINPDIDPKLFETPPDNVTSRDAWKKFLRKGGS